MFKVWNFQNGHNINQFQSVAEAEITGLVPLGKKKGVLAVGWSRQIVFYNEEDSEVSVADRFLFIKMFSEATNVQSTDPSWRGMRKRKKYQPLAPNYLESRLGISCPFLHKFISIVYSVLS